jgi:hypothetical protein
MLQELSTKTNLAQIGEEIGLELGSQMVKSYRDAHPTDVQWYMIGREIIEKILAQPGCVGIKFFNAYNEVGQKTMVYVGIDKNAETIIEYSVVNTQGMLTKKEGIVADRIRVPTETVIGDDNIFAE